MFQFKKRNLLLASISAIALSTSVIHHAQAQAGTETTTGQTTKTPNSSLVRKPAIHVVEQALPELLRQAARRNGFQITMTSRVRGTLKKVSLPLDIEQLLTQIAGQFDLKWHFQEKQLFVSVGSEDTSRMVFLGETQIADLEKALESAKLKSKNYNLTYVEDSNAVIINGPVSYIASVELLAEALSKNKAIQRGKLKIIKFGNVIKR